MVPSWSDLRVNFQRSIYVAAAIWGIVASCSSVWSQSLAEEKGRAPDSVNSEHVKLPGSSGPMATNSDDKSLLIPPAPTSDEPPVNAVGQQQLLQVDQAGSGPVLPMIKRNNAAEGSKISTRTGNALVPPLPAMAEEEPWSIAIVPMDKPDAPLLVRNYDAVYQSIPYHRAEYLANPSYRHEATMEILFGQLRPTVVHRTDTPQRIVNPRPQLTQPYPLSKGELYSYWPLLQYGSPLPLLSPVQ